MTVEQQPRGYAMTTDAKKRLAEAQAELLAAADPHAWPESAELVELRATVARVRALADESIAAGTPFEVGTFADGVRCGAIEISRRVLGALNGGIR